MRAYDIEWDIDIEEAFEKLDTMTLEEAAAALDIPKEIEDDEETISDWLSDEFGWCHRGFRLS